MPRGRHSRLMAYSRRLARNRVLVQDAKSKPCKDCGTNYPFYVMDFDHVTGEKKFNIAMFGNKSKKQLVEEIAKCEVVCANCHREREFSKFLTAPPTL